MKTKAVVGFLLSALLATACGGVSETEEALDAESIASALDGEGVSATFRVTTVYLGGYCGRVTVSNDSASATVSWTVTMDMDGEQVTWFDDGEFSSNGDTVTITPDGSNAVIAPGSSVEPRFCATGTYQDPATVTAVSAVFDDPGTGGAGGTGSSCLDGITDFTSTGPFRHSEQQSGRVKLWVPDVPSDCRVPVVHLANGTGALCSTYGAILDHLASHGFLAACYEDPNTGDGQQCIDAVEVARSLYPNLVSDAIGFTGHSQGGGAAFICTYRAEEKWGNSFVYAGLAMEPASGFGDAPWNWESLYGQIDSPMFMFNGSLDILVSRAWVQMAFDALPSTTEAYFYTAIGATHIPIPTRWTEESAVAWFRWKLLGDSEACRYFKDMPNSYSWSLQTSQNESACP